LSVIVNLVDKGAQANTGTEKLVFGGLAVVTLLVQGGRPMALRPRLSAGLPLSNKRMERCKQNEPGCFPGSPNVSI
jgi:hypothetical protein